jgi:hypothetical protein
VIAEIRREALRRASCVEDFVRWGQILPRGIFLPSAVLRAANITALATSSS